MKAFIINAGCEETVSAMAVYALTSEGFEVREASEMSAVREALSEGFIPDIIVACRFDDVGEQMPLRALKAHAPLKDVPVLLIANEDELDMQMNWKEAGVTGWVVRPFTTFEFLEMVGMMMFSKP